MPEVKVDAPKIEEPKIEVKEKKEVEIQEPIKSEEEIKKEVEESMADKSTEQIFAEQNSIAFEKKEDWTITFRPTSAEQWMDIAMQFWPDKISTEGIEKEQAKKVFNKYSKYKGASSDVYIQGFKDNEIGVGGETWERLVRINWGQPTAEMLKAQEQFEEQVKINEVNNTIKQNSWKEIDSKLEENSTTIKELDKNYKKSIQALHGDLSWNWDNFKSWNKKLQDINNSLNNTASQIDNLNLEKRKILDQVKDRNPSLSLGQQLVLADRELDAIDDSLFGLQRQYNMDMSSYKFQDTKLQWEFEFQAGLVEQKLKLQNQCIKTSRSDIIRQDQITRQDTLLKEEIERAEQSKQQAVNNGDAQLPKNHAYSIALLKEKAKLNDEYADKFSTANLAWGAVMKLNKKTGEHEVVSAPSETASSTIPTTFKDLDFTRNQDLINKFS